LLKYIGIHNTLAAFSAGIAGGEMCAGRGDCRRENVLQSSVLMEADSQPLMLVVRTDLKADDSR